VVDKETKNKVRLQVGVVVLILPYFSDLTLLTGCSEYHLAHKNMEENFQEISLLVSLGQSRDAIWTKFLPIIG